MIPNPEIDSFRKAAERFSRPRDMGIDIGGEKRVLRSKAVVLLLGIGYVVWKWRRSNVIEGEGEGHGFDMGGGETEGRRTGWMRNEGVCPAMRGDMNGDFALLLGVASAKVVGPGGESRPVGNGVGDDAGLVGGDVIPEEVEWGWRLIETVDGGADTQAQFPHLLP